MTSLERKGTLLVLSTAFISGVSIFINKFGVKGFDPFVFTWLKNSLVAVFLLGLLLGTGEVGALRKLSGKDWLLLIAIGLVGGAIPFLLFFKGLSLTTGANAAFIHKGMFVYVAFLAAVLLKEKIDWRFLLGGAFLFLGNALFLKVLPLGVRQGDFLILMATIFWAGESVLSKHALKKLSPKVVSFGRMGIGSAFILLFLLATGRIASVAALTVPHFGWVILTSLFLFGYVVSWYTGLQYLKASVATSILLLGGPVTAFLTLVGSGVGIVPTQALGILLLIGGAILAGRVYELVRS